MEVLVDVESLIVITALVIIELIVDTIRLILYIAILEVGKDIPLFVDMISSLNKGICIKLGSIRIIILMITACQICLTYEVVGCVCHKTKVVPGELLFRNTCDDVPTLIFVICIQYRTVAMLCQSFLSYEICFLYIFAISICCHKSELG